MMMPPMQKKNAKLPVNLPKQKPDRNHALAQNTKHTIRNLSNVVIYLWLNNGTGFWYYISHATQNTILGYAWNGKQWVRREISLRMVWSYY